jgi:signal transduction protein with GAF and PtsI domain
MHELYERVNKEIHGILLVGIKTNNIGILGQLVDIIKDIEMIWYYQSIRGSSIGELMTLNEQLKHTDSVELTNRYNKLVNDMIEEAEKLKSILPTLNISSEQMMKIKNIYK